MTTDLVLVSSYRITDQIIDDLDRRVCEFRSAVERSKAKKMAMLAVATSVPYAFRSKKRLALGGMVAGLATIAVSGARDIKRVEEYRREVRRLLNGARIDTNEQMLMLQLAFMDFDLLLMRGYTRPESGGKFTVVNGNTMSLCVSPESKGMVV